MGRRISCFLYSFCICLLLCFQPLEVRAQEAEETRIEQVDLNMPEVTVYGYGLEQAGEEPEAYLGQEKLKPTWKGTYQQMDQGMEYYILLDLSNSMPDREFAGVKEGILAFYQRLSEKDTAVLITFGETVQVQSEGPADYESLKQILDGLENKDQKTLLFEAVSQAASLSDQEKAGKRRRRAIIVISDGEDIAVGKRMAQEALELLKEKAVPVYALCIRNTLRENINSFGEFARMSGGDILVFETEESQDVMENLRQQLLEASVLTFQASTNKVTNQYEQFSLHIPQKESPVSKTVFSCRWIPDTTAPLITGVSQLEGQQIGLTFSEEVSGADMASNYTVVCDDAIIPVSAVARKEEDPLSFILTLSEPVKTGAYQISCVNITDISQEKNPVTNSSDFTMEGQPEEKEENVLPIAAMGILFFIILLAILLLAAFYRKIKKNRGLVFVEGKPLMASSVDVKQHVAILPAQSKSFEMIVSVSGRNPETLKLSIEKSMIVGRSDICDLYFDDSRMSRQHFALEWDGTDMYLTDLNTTNGTFINGVKVRSKRKLEQNDRICAGSEELVIKW